MIGRDTELRQYQDRLGNVYWVMGIALLALLSRLFFLQILRGPDFRRWSESNRLKKERLASTRGRILDRNGQIIVENRAAFDVILLSQYYPFDPATNIRLAEALGMPIRDLEKRLGKAERTRSFHPVLLKADVSRDVIAAIEMDAEGFPGIDIEATVQRRHPYRDLGAQMLGYIGEVGPADLEKNSALQLGDTIGKMGIEKTYDDVLRGSNGVGYVEVDARGRRRLTTEGQKLLGYVNRVDPKPGKTLRLTLDVELEKVAADAMRSRAIKGAIVAMDPNSGEVLAMVNEPSYDPEMVSAREIDTELWRTLVTSEHRPLRNRAIQDHYPPGSTFKLIVALAALAEGIVTPETSVNCKGFLKFGSRKFHCWHTHGTVDFAAAIQRSCDVFFYQLGIQLGIDTLAKYARLFGFGARSGFPVAGEAAGLIADSAWKLKRFREPWQPGETLSVAIGQGFVDVTPLQLVAAYAAIGSEGFLYRPFLVSEVLGEDGKPEKSFQPQLVRKIGIDAGHFKTVKEGLLEVVKSGTGVRARSQWTSVAGKTGTAQVRTFSNIKSVKCEDLPYDDRDHGWFVGYAPTEKPEIAVVAIAEHSCHSAVAAPLVKEVVEFYLKKKRMLTTVTSFGPPTPYAFLDIKNDSDSFRGLAAPGIDPEKKDLPIPTREPQSGQATGGLKRAREPITIGPDEE